MGAREKDLNPDVFIGLQLPLGYSDTGFFKQTKTTFEQAKYNIVNLFKTIPGERLGQPTFGCGLLKVLFEPMTDDLINDVETNISEAMAEWLPHVTINKLNVEQDEIEVNQLNIDFEFSLDINPQVHDTVTFNFITGT